MLLECFIISGGHSEQGLYGTHKKTQNIQLFFLFLFFLQTTFTDKYFIWSYMYTIDLLSPVVVIFFPLTTHRIPLETEREGGGVIRCVVCFFASGSVRFLVGVCLRIAQAFFLFFVGMYESMVSLAAYLTWGSCIMLCFVTNRAIPLANLSSTQRCARVGSNLAGQIGSGKGERTLLTRPLGLKPSLD